MKAFAGRALCVLVLPALAYAIYSSARQARADSDYRLNTPESLARAVQDDPGNADYHALRAEHIEGLGGDPAPEREKAALLDPLESRYWIDLGMMAELRGDMSGAERYLLKAASVDRKFGPRWALMNFYFRQHRDAEFWQWTQAALPMAYGDLSMIFRLCWLMTNDSASIARMLPHTDLVRTQYLIFLIDEGHLDAAPAIAREVAARATPGELDLLMQYCDTSMRNNTASAVEVWNALVRRKLEPFNALSPAGGAIITDGEFRQTPIEHGFDWRVAKSDGVSVTFGSAIPGATVGLSGDQDQTVAILSEWVPVEPGKSYRIDYRYTADGENANKRQASGLAWEVEDPASRKVLGASEDLKNASGTQSGSLQFTAGETGAAILRLRYTREPGTFRHEENFTIQSIASQVAAR